MHGLGGILDMSSIWFRLGRKHPTVKRGARNTARSLRIFSTVMKSIDMPYPAFGCLHSSKASNSAGISSRYLPLQPASQGCGDLEWPFFNAVLSPYETTRVLGGFLSLFFKLKSEVLSAQSAEPKEARLDYLNTFNKTGCQIHLWLPENGNVMQKMKMRGPN